MLVKVKCFNDAPMPQIHNGDCFDLTANEIAVVPHETAQLLLDVNGKTPFKHNLIEYHSHGTLTYNKGDIILVKLGVAMELPEGWRSNVFPRSGTFSKYGLILTNSVGIIDNSYKGNNDQWLGMFLAHFDSSITVGERIVQCEFVPVHAKKFNLVQTDTLESDDRGGFGSTGR